MQFIDKALEQYCIEHSTGIPDYLQQLERETHLKTLAPQMLSGPLQGRFLAMVVNMIKPKTIVEVGTFTGYASLCMAEGLPDDGKLYTIEANDEVVRIAQRFFEQSPFADQIVSLVGKAEEVIPTLDISIDLAFIDGGKQLYADHYEQILEKMPVGGYILADNVLWSGKVLDPTNADDVDTQYLQAFNDRILADSRVESVMLPLRDGVSIVRKIN